MKMLTFMKILWMSCFIYSVMLMSSSNHPLILGTLTILQSVFLSLFMAATSMTSWFSFILFIIYMGGILMLFSYIISMTNSKEQLFNNSKKKMTFAVLLVLVFLNMMKKENSMNFKNLSIYKNMISLFSYSMKMMVFLTVFLLFILVNVVYVIDLNKSNMRME